MDPGPPSPGWRTSKRPVGQPTRGKTADQRLRTLDAFVALEEDALLRRPGPEPFVDLGFGDRPVTTREAATRFARLQPKLRVLAVEIDRERVAHAQSFASSPEESPPIQFALGGFDLVRDHPAWMPARLIRAMNVLRQYDESQVVGAWQTMGRALMQGGLLVEGTSDPLGRLLVVHRWRRRGDVLLSEGLVFLTRTKTFADPTDFQAVLPKSHIHKVVADEPVHGLFDDWERAWRSTSAIEDASRRFAATGQALQDVRPDVRTPKRWLRRGALFWRLGLAIPLAACAPPDLPVATTEPEIRLLYPTDTTPVTGTSGEDGCETTLLVVVDLVDFTFEPPIDGEEIAAEEGIGHYHVNLDGAYYGAPTELWSHVVTTRCPGDALELNVSLVGNDHVDLPHEGRWEETIVLTIGEAG